MLKQKQKYIETMYRIINTEHLTLQNKQAVTKKRQE